MTDVIELRPGIRRETLRDDPHPYAKARKAKRERILFLVYEMANYDDVGDRLEFASAIEALIGDYHNENMEALAQVWLETRGPPR